MSTQPIRSMDQDEFWNLIDASRPDHPDPERHADQLADALVELGVDETVAFGFAFDEAMSALYTWDLWGAAFLALQGCGDDSFEYLRAWLIGQGRETWGSAHRSPEQTFIDLLAASPDPDARWDQLALHDGEPLLYAAGVAHDRLTGEWRAGSGIGPDEPSGAEWDEDDLPGRFATLMAALPRDWWADTPDEPFEQNPLLDAVIAGLEAFGAGDHETGKSLLDPLLDDASAWEQITSLGLSSDVAYVVGINRLIAGDPLGARHALGKADGDLDHVRRARAQVNLSLGDLDTAEDLLDDAPDAHLMDRALQCVLARRRGDAARAVQSAMRLLEDAEDDLGHPWDIAGVLFQAAYTLAELGEMEAASGGAERIHGLIASSPEDLPLRGQALILDAAVARLAGRAVDARAMLESALPSLSGPDRGQALVEAARAEAAVGASPQAYATYERAIAALEESGERWLVDETRREQQGLPSSGDPGG